MPNRGTPPAWPAAPAGTARLSGHPYTTTRDPPRRTHAHSWTTTRDTARRTHANAHTWTSEQNDTVNRPKLPQPNALIGGHFSHTKSMEGTVGGGHSSPATLLSV